jgi:hypothetical protein
MEIRTFELTECLLRIENVCNSHRERLMMCCTMCHKVHLMPSACVLDRTPNDRDRTTNVGLTLKVHERSRLAWQTFTRWQIRWSLSTYDLSHINKLTRHHISCIPTLRVVVTLPRACEVISVWGRRSSLRR